jgi:exodeoxyribonuclease V alpha subunit
MLDIELFAELLDRIEPGRHQLILVGDHNQLPPVGAGNVIRDFYDHFQRAGTVREFPPNNDAGVPAPPIIPVVELTQVMRQAGPLKSNSTAILSTGKIAPTVDAPSALGPRVWTVANTLADPGDVTGFLEYAVGDIFPNQYKMDAVRDVQILTPQRKGLLGVDALNELMQGVVQRRLDPSWQQRKRGYRPALCVGDKVIQRRNNYRLGEAGLFNGTLGVVLDVQQNGDMRIRWDDGQTILHSMESGECDNVELAYALTVHQTQGSEFPYVVFVCHKSHHFMHSRNLIYTAVTRARQGIAIIGDQWGIQTAAKDLGAHERRTWLSEWSAEWWKNCTRWPGEELDEIQDIPF